MLSFLGNFRLKFNSSSNLISRSSEEEWFEEIFKHAISQINLGRSVLIFFDTDIEISKFKENFVDKFDRLRTLTENTGEQDKEKYINESGITKTITLVTRGMGHGIDFKSSIAKEKNGGVYVIQTFFSLDTEEETHIKSITARKGNRGSYELILCKKHLINAGFLKDQEVTVNYESLSKLREEKMKEKDSNSEKRIIFLKKESSSNIEQPSVKREVSKEHDNRYESNVINVQNQQISDSGKDVSSFLNIEQAIEYLNSLGNWIGNEHWLASTVEELNKWYRELRKDIRKYANSWSYSEYCQRLAYHYYNLAWYFYNELFYKHKMDLRSVKKHLEKCLGKLAEICQEDYSNELKELKNDAKKILAEINETYKQQNNLLTKYSNSSIRKYTKLCIVLGNINQISLQQFFDIDRQHFEQKIQNIQLFRVINTLEDAITVTEYKNIFVTVEESNYLGQAYQIAGQSSLSVRYTRTAENLVKKFVFSEAKEYDNEKEIIKEIVSREIAEYKSNLAQVKSCIEEKFHKSLSTIDNAYIDRKYIKYCAKFWLQETTNFLKELIENKSRTVIQEIFNSLDGIQNLSQIPNPLSQLECYTLLMENYKLVREEDEKTCISRFKKEVVEQTATYSEAVEKELKFLNTFVDFLSASQNLQSITVELKLEDFCGGELSFDEFLKGIIDLEVSTYGASLAALQEAAKCLQQKDDLFLIGNFKEIIGAYIKPVQIQERKIDGRLVIEVKGKNVIVSEILYRLENKLLENSIIEEVRFVGADIIHIDTSLKREIWQGKNLAILTKAVKIHNKVIWKVSGKDNNYAHSNNAGTGKDGHGKQGKDGYPGESGGNVLILAEMVENPENLTIISNGGKGGKGQDGGSGRDGKDGAGITKKEFDDKFPSVVKFASSQVDRQKLLEKTIQNIANFLAISIEWCKKDNVFIEGRTEQGNKITFSCCWGSLSSRYQAFLLYEGSLGQPGGHGGVCGLGGQGGYAGEIIVRNLENSSQEFSIMKNTNQGKEGEVGKGGLYGRHGKNGWDMGYLDYQSWRNPEFRGTDQNSKCTLEYFSSDNEPSNRVWCPQKNKYAGITVATIEHKKKKQYEERKSTRQNNDRQHHAQAVRKKNISSSSILANYCYRLNSVAKSTLEHLRSDLESTKQLALQALVKNQELQEQRQDQLQQQERQQEQQQKQQIMDLGIKRHLNSGYQSRNKHININVNVTSSASYETAKQIVENLIDELKNDQLSPDNWLKLKNIELSISQLDQFFSSFEALKNSSQDNVKNSKLQDIEKLLIDKYRLATLQEIAKHLPPYQEVTDNIELSPESAARYLVEKEKNNNISHPILGTLNQYLYEDSIEQREKIMKFCGEKLQNNNNETLKYSVRAFVLEVAKSENVHYCIKKYYNEHKEFLEKQEKFFNAFKSELSQSRHVEIFNLWIESIKDKSLRSKLEEKIEEDDCLKALYSRFNNQFKLEYDWVKCCKDLTILKEYNDYIREKGPLSVSYRELLAHIFDINIILYAEDQDNRFSLQDNHNISSKKSIHVLCKANEFMQLNINENYLKLKEERKKKGEFYAKIFKAIRLLKQKQEFDDYLKKKAFLSNNTFSEDNQYSNEEEEDIKKIIQYFSGEEKQQLKARLEKITSQYIGTQEILHNILKHFSSEGKHVSYQELCYLINSILSVSIRDREEQITFSWIVAAHCQRHWIDELILLKLENRFKRQLEEKSKWREYLSKIENKDVLLLFGAKLDQDGSISTQCIENILHLLSNILNETVSLEELELSEWPYVLKEKFWLCKVLPLINWQESEKLPTASYYLLSIENIFGTDLVEKLLEVIEEKKQDLSPDMFINILYNFHNEKWNLSEEELKTLCNYSIREWTQKMQEKFTADENERDITQLVELIKGNANTSKEIANNLSTIADSIKTICGAKYVISGKSVCGFTETCIENWVKEFRSSSINEGKQDIENKMLAVIDRAIELKRGFRLRDTQRLTILSLFTNDRNTLAQVSTGEGKSLIVVAASIMKTLLGEKVDIITSSSVLAKRDAEGNRDIYSLFHINVSHNCSEDIEKRKEAYSGSEVVYGDLSNFQRDYLLDKFYKKNILGDRNFQNVIIDEVDSMLLDKGNNMLYLSHDLAGLDKLESIYIYIWHWINRPARNYEQISYAFNVEAIKEAVISELYGLVKKEDIGKLGSKLNEQQKNIIWERLIEANILDGQGKLLKESINDNKLEEILCKILMPEFSSYKDRLNHLLQEYIGREKFIYVPNYLKSFVEQHLESWIKNAVTAFFMKAGQDYVVDVDRTGTSPDRNPNITILDRDTGTDQANSQWNESLHQFLQLKHGCKLSLQSLKAVFISNVSYFKLYSHLYGLTGTLGSQRERDLLWEVHKVDFVTIPTAKSTQFHEEKPILCTDQEEWINHIRNEVNKVTEENKRSVLIICETVNDVEVLYKAFGEKDAKHVHTYIRDYEEFDIAQGNKKLAQGQIIIATNLAGRGTDIKITEGLRKAGGLHVCLTYLSSNIRIEQQAFGRAARSGDKGSGQLIIMDSKGQEYSNSRIIDLKKERDAEELYRVSDIKTHYETQITMEESCFKAFKEQYERLNSMLSESLKDNSVAETIAKTVVTATSGLNIFTLQDLKDKTELKEIMLQSCLDKWTFWLDRNSKQIEGIQNKESKARLNNSLNEFLLHLKNLRSNSIEDFLAWVKENPVQMVKFGKYLSKNEKYDDAIRLFDEVNKQESYFSEAAHYYKAFALANKIDWEILKEEDKKILKEFKQELREAARLLDEHSKFAVNAAGIIGEIKKNNNESIIQIDAYEEQQKSLTNLYYMFSQSIEDILGHFITPQSFVNSDIKEILAEVLYEDLLREGVLKKPRVKKNISEEELKIISSGYGISVKTLKNFLSKYKGREIDVKEFQKMLKKEVQLPSREAFWKLLIKQEVLSGEVKYIVVDNEKLREIDPSLLDSLKQLEKQHLEFKDKQIFLNAEYVTQQKNNGNVFEKDGFIKAIGKKKYQILKKRGILSFNRKADIDPNKIKYMTFPCYDSITLEDFTKVNITKTEAEKILAEQDVFTKKDNSENSAYGLKVKFDEIEQSFCPIYENAVKRLLSVCFKYRIALQKIEKQLDRKSFSIRLEIMTKPHQSLVFELLDQQIIKPSAVTTENEDLEAKLKNIYGQKMTEDNFRLMLSQNKLIPKECTKKLFNCLVEKNWISKYTPSQAIKEEGINIISMENIENAGKSLVQDLYYINSQIKDKSGVRKISLNFFPEGSHENVLTKSQNIDKTVEKILDNRLQITKEDTIQNIVSTLQRLKCSLKATKVPDGKLKSFTELYGQGEFINIEEVHVFFLNGLDQLLQLEEKKWTRKMLCNTVIVTAMGITQIAIGTAIELYSVGIMTHVGEAFVNEGVSDLFYAAGALKSGYFSWKDYRQHKLESLMLTAATVCIGAYLSRGAKVSRFGYKLAGPTFEYGMKVAKITGNKLIEIAGWHVIGMVAKRITLKATEALVFGFANAAVDTIVENYLQALCEGIASNILSNIEQEVERHNISMSLKKAYETIGKESARKMVNNLTRSVFTQQNCVEKFLPIASKIISSVIQGITGAVKKRSKTSNNLELPIYTIGKVVVWLERFVQIADITMFSNSLLNYLDQEMKDSLNKLEKDAELSVSNQKQGTEKDYDSFKKEVVDQWKSLLREKVGQVIAQHVLSPILKDGSHHLLKYVGRKMQERYKSYKESRYLEQFKQLKQEYEEKQQREQQCDNRSKTKKHITEEYHKNLRKLMIATRNPDLLAHIVRENIPMDMTCVSACTQVVHQILKERGVEISELTIIVEGDNRVRQKFSSLSEGTESIIIPLELKDNHFEFCGSSTSENNRNSDLKNNCLYDALLQAIPGLRNIIAPEEFRAKVANRIERDPNIQHHIRQGWHQFPISRGAYGGAISIPTSLNKDAETESPFEHKSDRGKWEFDNRKDVDLREVRPLSNKELHSQRTAAFNAALSKINQNLSSIGKLRKPVCPGDFQAKKYDVVLCTSEVGRLGAALYPVEIETKVEVWVKDIREYVEYRIRIDIDNPVITSDLQGPHGPHIGYDVIRLNNDTPKGDTGHILINKNEGLPDRGRSLYADAAYKTTIPVTRLFFPPTRSNTYLERIDKRNIFETQKTIGNNTRTTIEIEKQFERENRGRSYPSSDF